MCGYLAVFRSAGKPFADGDFTLFQRKSALLTHRGNSSHGHWTNPDTALYHHRLAFRDLKDGTQPLFSPDRSAVILFNGELYGFRTLRGELARDYRFHSRSDTELILAAYLVLGEEKFLKRLDGEFAFVIKDFRTGKILAARDPFGVKPLFFASRGFSPSTVEELRYYGEEYRFHSSADLMFASEMKGLPLPLRWERRGFERQLLGLYEEMGTAFQNVYQLAPGALLSADKTGDGWSLTLKRVIQKRRAIPGRQSFEENAAELKQLVHEAVELKLDSDVPLGAYLSGGIDSRIAAFEMGRSGAQIQTFTVGFEGKDYDESEDVGAFLKSYPNLKGRVLRTTNESLSYAYTHAVFASELVQPYTNGSAKWWLSRFARRHVRGVLTGDGSDELFCGYPSYRYLAWWQWYQKNPTKAREALYAARSGGKGEKFWEKGLSSLENGSDLLASVKEWGWEHPLYEQIRVMSALALNDDGGRDFRLRERESLQSYVALDEGSSPLTRWQNYFLHTHFPTHVLNWVGDRMEMANTLEGRPIYLTKAILQLTRSLPDHHLVRGLRDKAILRRAYRDELMGFSRSPKKQFNAPFLYDGPLGERYLSKESLKNSAIIDPESIRRARALVANPLHPIHRSYAMMYLQNCLVAQLLDEYLVREKPPERELGFEERFLDERTEEL